MHAIRFEVFGGPSALVNVEVADPATDGISPWCG
jgi:hypothetical protein